METRSNGAERARVTSARNGGRGARNADAQRGLTAVDRAAHVGRDALLHDLGVVEIEGPEPEARDDDGDDHGPVTTRAKMLGGASQIVSRIRVKGNGKQNKTYHAMVTSLATPPSLPAPAHRRSAKSTPSGARVRKMPQTV